MRRTPLRRIGAVTRKQMAFNKSMMQRWTKALGKVPTCAVTGQAGVVVGHIVDVAVDPSMRFDPKNVAPITKWVNGRMRKSECDPKFRFDAHGLMLLWNDIFWEEHPEA